MPAWTLEWNGLTSDEKKKLREIAGWHVCPSCGDGGQAAVDMFSATVRLIQARDRREIEATLKA